MLLNRDSSKINFSAIFSTGNSSKILSILQNKLRRPIFSPLPNNIRSLIKFSKNSLKPLFRLVYFFHKMTKSKHQNFKLQFKWSITFQKSLRNNLGLKFLENGLVLVQLICTCILKTWTKFTWLMWKNLMRKKISINFKTRQTVVLYVDRVTHSQTNLNP